MTYAIAKTGGRIPGGTGTWWVVSWKKIKGWPPLPVIGMDVKFPPLTWKTKAGAQAVVDQIMANRRFLVDKSAVYEVRSR